MADSGLSITQSSAAGAYARAEVLGASIPVRPTDPTRQRFEVADDAVSNQTENQPKSAVTSEEGQSSERSTTQDKPSSGGGWGLLGAFTSFLARVFGQQGEAEATAAAAASPKAGADAYARAAGPVVAEPSGIEIISPSFSPPFSGHALDLLA